MVETQKLVSRERKRESGKGKWREKNQKGTEKAKEEKGNVRRRQMGDIRKGRGDGKMKDRDNIKDRKEWQKEGEGG